MTRRISSSRPMTGSSLPLRASSVRSRPYLLEGLVLALGVLVGDALVAAYRSEGAKDALAVEAEGLEDIGGGAAAGEERKEQMLRADVVVAQGGRFFLGLAHRFAQRVCHGHLDGPVGFGQAFELDLHLAHERGRVDVGGAQEGRHDASVLLCQGGEQMEGVDGRVRCSTSARRWASRRASWAFSVSLGMAMAAVLRAGFRYRGNYSLANIHSQYLDSTFIKSVTYVRLPTGEAGRRKQSGLAVAGTVGVGSVAMLSRDPSSGRERSRALVSAHEARRDGRSGGSLEADQA